MNLDLVIAQLKLAPLFAGNVAGAAEYEAAAEDQVWLPRPAAYVIPLEDEPGENQVQTGIQQVIREGIGVILDLDNRADRRGQAAAASLDAMRAQVFRVLLGWRSNPARQARGFAYHHGGLLGMNRVFLRWQLDFTIETTIDDADGWQPPFEPLRSIENVLAVGKSLPGETAPAAPLFTLRSDVPIDQPPTP